MQYPVAIPGFESSELVIEVCGLFSDPKLFVNGQPVAPGQKKGEFLLVRDDGAVVTAKFGGVMLDGMPKLTVGDESYSFAEPLPWYQWVWGGLPLVLLFLGGCIGGALGGAAIFVNARIFRSDMKPAVQYLVTGLVSLVAVIGYVFFVAVLQAVFPDVFKSALSGIRTR